MIKTEDHGASPLKGVRWTAIEDDQYTGPESPVGFGDTEAEAIADLQVKAGLVEAQ